MCGREKAEMAGWGVANVERLAQREQFFCGEAKILRESSLANDANRLVRPSGVVLGSYGEFKGRDADGVRGRQRLAGGFAILQMQADGIFDVAQGLLVGVALGVAALEHRAVRKVAGAISLDHHFQHDGFHGP